MPVQTSPLADDTAETLERVAERHEADRATVTCAIRQDARAHRGEVNPNRVRSLLTDPVSGKCVVLPQAVGATYRVLVQAGVLLHAGWDISTDAAGGNQGRPCRTYIATEVTQ